jgi:Cu(I)/Ag(I) efflux system periplasmic protein CusF
LNKENTMKTLAHTLAAATFTLMLLTPAAYAQGSAVQGEVKKIDDTAGKVTLKHGPIKNLGMDQGMTMVFRVNDPAMLKQVKVGDKVEFEAENGASGYTVTKMQKAR